MIIIFSNKRDLSTHRVLDWLFAYEIPFVIIYPESDFQLISVEIGNFTFKVDGKMYEYTQLSGMWKRRGYIPAFWDFSHIKESSLPNGMKQKILQNLHIQEGEIIKYLVHLLDELPCINKIDTSHENKLKMLHYAKEVGLAIPDTLVTNSPTEVFNTFNTEHLITKSIDRPFSLIYDNYAYGHHTVAVKRSTIRLQKDIGYSIFQNQLSKIFELRIFHFFGKNYAMAIFSQQDEKTKVDFRNYNHEYPNRNEPFKLPELIEKKINHFMQMADLNTGSLDIVVTEEEEYVFLEVNPVGQWEVLVADCNYNIHKMIVDKLKEFIDAKRN